MFHSYVEREGRISQYSMAGYKSPLSRSVVQWRDLWPILRYQDRQIDTNSFTSRSLTEMEMSQLPEVRAEGGELDVRCWQLLMSAVMVITVVGVYLKWHFYLRLTRLDRQRISRQLDKTRGSVTTWSQLHSQPGGVRNMSNRPRVIWFARVMR